MLTVDPDLQSAINEERQTGEKILWTGRPNPVRYALRDPWRVIGALGTVALAVFMLVLFSQFWGGFSVRGVSGFNPFASFSSFFLLILAVIVLVSVGQPIVDFLKAGRMIYAVTDRRLMIVTLPWAWWGKSVQSFGDQDIQRLDRASYGDGTGDLVFATETYQVRQRYGYRTRIRKVGFFGIPDAKAVEQLVIDTFKRDA